MKTTALLLALLMLFLCISGCQPNVPVDTQPTTTEPVTEDVTEDVTPDTTVQSQVSPVPENLYSVSVPITTEYGAAEDETVLFSYSYQSMHLIHPDRDVADKIIIDFLGRVEETRVNAQLLFDAVKEKDHTSAGFEPCAYQVHYNPMRIDQGVLSLHGHISQSSDSAHSNVQCVSASYDMVTGDPLTLGSILYRADVKDALCDIVISILEKRSDVHLYEDFRDSVKNRFSRDESQDEEFYFTSQGLNFYFPPYEIAPYSFGTVTVEIPYHQLTGIIGDAYFPAEQINSGGTLEICEFEKTNLESYNQFAEIIVDPGSTKILLTTDDAVQDIRIQALTWDRSSSMPLDPSTIFAANILTAQEAILLDASFRDDKPSFIVTYTIDGTIYHFYLIKDPSTGMITLAERY